MVRINYFKSTCNKETSPTTRYASMKSARFTPGGNDNYLVRDSPDRCIKVIFLDNGLGWNSCLHNNQMNIYICLITIKKNGKN
jgi:hypothetical protein